MPWLVDALKTRSCIMDSWQSSVDANGMFEMHFVAYHVDVASFPFLSPGSSIEYNAPIQIQSFGGQTVSTYANAGAPYNFTVRLHPNDITDEFLSTLLEMYDMQYSFMGQQNPYERFASLVRHSRSEDCSV